MKTEKEYIKEGWERINCPYCGAYGWTPDYGNGEDFYGTKECSKCKGSGRLWQKGNVIKQYPWGSFV